MVVVNLVVIRLNHLPKVPMLYICRPTMVFLCVCPSFLDVSIALQASSKIRGYVMQALSSSQIEVNVGPSSTFTSFPSILQRDRLRRLINVFHETLVDIKHAHGGTLVHDAGHQERHFFKKVRKHALLLIVLPSQMKSEFVLGGRYLLRLQLQVFHN